MGGGERKEDFFTQGGVKRGAQEPTPGVRVCVCVPNLPHHHHRHPSPPLQVNKGRGYNSGNRGERSPVCVRACGLTPQLMDHGFKNTLPYPRLEEDLQVFYWS